MRVICVTLITVLALGLMTASGASAKPPVLELKEAGAPVPVGTEVTVELKLWTGCYRYSEGEYHEEPFAFHGHIAVNDARTDILTFSAEEVYCEYPEIYPSYVAGNVKEISIVHSGRQGSTHRCGSAAVARNATTQLIYSRACCLLRVTLASKEKRGEH
jgi:hypothetical protein